MAVPVAAEAAQQPRHHRELIDPRLHRQLADLLLPCPTVNRETAKLLPRQLAQKKLNVAD